jgi:hypothetical protein
MGDGLQGGWACHLVEDIEACNLALSWQQQQQQQQPKVRGAIRGGGCGGVWVVCGGGIRHVLPICIHACN